MCEIAHITQSREMKRRTTLVYLEFLLYLSICDCRRRRRRRYRYHSCIEQSR